MPSANRGCLVSGKFELGWSVEGKGPSALVIGSAVYYPRTFSRELRKHLRFAFVDHRGFWQDVQVNMPAFDHLWGETFRDIDMRQVLSDVQAPMFVAMGHFDYLVAPYFTWEPYREHCRDLTLRVFDRSGHTPQLEESENFDAELLGWLNRRQA